MSEIVYQEETSVSLPSTPEMREAAVAVAEAFLEDVEAPVAAEPTAPSAPTPMLPPQGETITPQAPDIAPLDFAVFEPQLSPELAELLEDEPPDFDAEARAEVAAELQAAEDQGVYYDGDPDSAARLKALEKRNAFLEGRLVETNRGKWLAENLRAYPLVNQFAKARLEGVDASSRRAFAREAARINAELTPMAQQIHEHVAKTLAAKPTPEMQEAARLLERDRVTAAWGTPAADLAASGASAEKLARMRTAQESGDMQAVFKEMILPDA